MSEVLIIIIIYLIAKLSLDILQIQTIKTVPIDQQSIDLLGINSNEEYKSRRYNIEKLKISIIRNVIFVGWIIYLLSGGLVIEINSYLKSFSLGEYIHNLGVILTVFIFARISVRVINFTVKMRRTCLKNSVILRFISISHHNETEEESCISSRVLSRMSLLLLY